MALADREQEQRRPRCARVDREDRAPATVGLRDVVLGAAAEARAVASFRLARAQGSDRNPVRGQLLDRRFDRVPRRLGRPTQILRKGNVVDAEIETRASRPVGDV